MQLESAFRYAEHAHIDKSSADHSLFAAMYLHGPGNIAMPERKSAGAKAVASRTSHPKSPLEPVFLAF